MIAGVTKLWSETGQCMHSTSLLPYFSFNLFYVINLLQICAIKFLSLISLVSMMV